MNHGTQATHEFRVHEPSGIFPQQVLVVKFVVLAQEKQVLCKFFDGSEIVDVDVTVGRHDTLVVGRMCPEYHRNNVITKKKQRRIKNMYKESPRKLIRWNRSKTGMVTTNSVLPLERIN